MQKIKKAVSALLVAGVLAAAPVAPAQAGIILAPTGVGLIVLIIGLVYGDPLLIILDADGNLSQDSLAKALDAKYPQINDSDVTAAMAAKIREKAISTTANAKGEKNVTLNRAELSEILAPTGLEEANSAAFEQIVSDLQ
jgi:hypothetical protein